MPDVIYLIKAHKSKVKVKAKPKLKPKQNSMPEIEILTPGEVLSRGLELVGFSMTRQQSVRREKNLQHFATHFGARPAVCAAIWTDLQMTNNEKAFIDVVELNASLEHMLMAACFLKCYPKDNQSEAIFERSSTTIRRWVWFCIGKLQALKLDKIVWPQHWNPSNSASEPESAFTVTVDGVHFRIQEPTHGRHSKNPAFYSHKFKQAGLAYEIALSIFDNRCVWVNGPFAAGKNNLSVFRAGLKAKMGNGKLGIADKGHRGEGAHLTMAMSIDSQEVREFKSRALARHEKFNGQVKNFGCMSEQFRHGLEKHKMCFEATVVICQHELENGSPLMAV